MGVTATLLTTGGDDADLTTYTTGVLKASAELAPLLMFLVTRGPSPSNITSTSTTIDTAPSVAMVTGPGGTTMYLFRGVSDSGETDTLSILFDVAPPFCLWSVVWVSNVAPWPVYGRVVTGSDQGQGDLVNPLGPLQSENNGTLWAVTSDDTLSMQAGALDVQPKGITMLGQHAITDGVYSANTLAVAFGINVTIPAMSWGSSDETGSEGIALELLFAQGDEAPQQSTVVMA